MSEYEEVIVRLDKANTIIEEIVRCKDCRWYKDFDGCFFSTAEVNPLDYCSHGIRKSEDEYYDPSAWRVGKRGRVMTTTNASTTKMYCASSGKWCEFANLQGFCTLTACCKRVIYDDRTTIIKRKEK